MKTTKNFPALNLTKISLLILALFFSFALSAQPAKEIIQISTSIISDSKVQLEWSEESSTVSHFVIERSMNGGEFNEIAMIFTGDLGNTYMYADKLNRNINQTLQYRLKAVRFDGTSYYSNLSSPNSAIAKK